jgi:class 3 adenylate cyclase
LERKLAAILAADVVGYSRLMGQDEAGTLERLKSLRRQLVQPKITAHKNHKKTCSGQCKFGADYRNHERPILSMERLTDAIRHCHV